MRPLSISKVGLLTLIYHKCSLNVITESIKLLVDWTFDISKPENSVTDFKVIDLKDWVWTRYPLCPQQWVYMLPQFSLNASLLIKVGSNNQSEFNMAAFESCRNEKFLMQILELSTQIVPIWIQVYDANQTFSIIRSKIQSVGMHLLSYQAQLVTYTFPYNNTAFSTPVYQSYFEFVNDNWNVVQIEHKDYLVVGKLYLLSIQFADSENDPISTSGQSTQINFMISLNQRTSNGTLYIQANNASVEPAEIMISYTDSYHKDLTMWKNFTLTYNLFISEPPVFKANPQNIELNRCESTSVEMPQFYDPDTDDSGYVIFIIKCYSSDIIVSLSSDTPSWITLNSNNSIFFNTTNNNVKIDDLTTVNIKLTDSTNAFMMYSFNVTVDSFIQPSLPEVDDMHFNWPILVSVPIQVQSMFNVTIVDCTNNQHIRFVTFDQSSSMLLLDIEQYQNCQDLCVKLKSSNSWANNVFSNAFWIRFNSGIPPVLTNAFGPLVINRGVLKLFQIPPDLFTSYQNSKIEYQANNCIDKIAEQTYIDIAKRTSSNNENKSTTFYLSAVSYDTFSSWEFPITATDSFGNSAEYLTNLNIVVWSSKDWADWSGPYEADWTKCKTGFTLQSTGSWLQNSLLPVFDTQIGFYFAIGIITAMSIVINVILIFKLKRLSVYPFEYAQPILIFLFAMDRPSQNIINFAQWLQWTKLNLGFIYIFSFRESLFWTRATDKLSDVQLYWQTTVQNYLFLILSVLILWCALKLWNRLLNSEYIQKLINDVISFIVNSNSIKTFMIDSVYPFMFANIINDIYSFSNHKLLSILSIGLLLIAVMHICMSPKQNTHQVSNNQQERSQNDKQDNNLQPSAHKSKFGVYFATIKSILYAWMFVFATKNTYLLWTFAIIVLHVAIVSMQLTDSREIWLELLIRKKSKTVLKHSADMSVMLDSISTTFIIYVVRVNDLTDNHGAVYFYVDTVIASKLFNCMRFEAFSSYAI